MDKKNLGRINFLVWLLVLIFMILALRLFYLQVIRHKFFLEKSIEQRTRVINLAVDRGDIYDRNGYILATSVDVYSIYLVPTEIRSPEATSLSLSKILSMNYDEIYKLATKKKYFVWLKRKIPEATAKILKEANLDGVGFLKEKKRVYPKGRLSSQLLGFVGLDNQGLSGIELGYDDILKGKEGKIIIESDPRGTEIATTAPQEIEMPTDGMNLTLTIDENIQYVAERELLSMVTKHGAKAGSLIMLNVKTGEILAIASYPDFDCNNYAKFSPITWKLAPITNLYEPGSTMKVITAAIGINENLVNPETVINCPVEYKIGATTIKNSHPISKNPPIKTLTDVIAESINTGILQVGLKVGPEKYYKYLKSFGFGEKTGVGFPGEPNGILREPKYWYASDLPMMTFGQTIAVTPLQLLTAISSIANQGVKVVPFLVKKVESPDGSYLKTYTEGQGEKVKVLSEDSVRKLTKVMEAVVYQRNGTGHLARSQYWKIAAKSGTAQKPKPGGGYLLGLYISSFIGFAPSDNPQISMLITIDEPKGTIWGATTCAPVFKTLTNFSLRYFDTPPSASIPSKEVL